MKFSQNGLDAYKAESAKTRDRSSAAPSAAEKVLKNSLPGKTSDSPGLIKTGTESGTVVPPAAKPESRASSSGGKGAGQAARFLLLLGKEEAGKVLRNMSEAEIEQVTAEIARIREIGRDEALEILHEFGHRVNLKGEGRGGIDTARDFLRSAFGEEKASAVLARAVPDSLPQPFSFMDDLSLPHILQILKDEPPETCAVILSFMEPGKVSEYIKSRNPVDQVSLVRLMARERQMDPEILSRMDGMLQEKVHKLGKNDEIEIDGKERLTEILRHMDSGSEKRILGNLEDEKPDLGREIREQLHTIDCIFKMRNRDLQNLLMEMDNDRIAFILRGKDDAVKDRILDSLSSQRKLIVEEAMILSPKVSRKEVDKETRAFLDVIRKREEEGSYIMLGEDEDEYI